MLRAFPGKFDARGGVLPLTVRGRGLTLLYSNVRNLSRSPDTKSLNQTPGLKES